MRKDEIALQILNMLLDKYERSSSFRGGKRRIILTPRTDMNLFLLLESPADRKPFMDAINELSSASLIGYENDRDDDSYPSLIYLLVDADTINRVYSAAGRKDKHRILENLFRKIADTAAEMPECDIKTYLLSALKKTGEYIIPRPFSGSSLDDDILKALSFMAANESEIMERVLSLRLYGNSKYFEKEVKSSVLSILRSIGPEKRDDELLSAYSVVRYPEEFMFKGDVIISFKDGSFTDFSALKSGSVITSSDADRAVCVISKTVSKITTVENKANYIQLAAEAGPDELVIFLGGFFSPARGRFLSLMHRSFPTAEYLHTGDIDLGGFLIFLKLKEIIPEIKPYMMDAAALDSYIDSAEPIGDGKYLASLQNLLEDESFSVFHPVISLMLEKRVRLEQESFLG